MPVNLHSILQPDAGVMPVVKYMLVAFPVHPVLVSKLGAVPGAASYVPGFAKFVYDAASDAAPFGW